MKKNDVPQKKFSLLTADVKSSISSLRAIEPSGWCS